MLRNALFAGFMLLHALLMAQPTDRKRQGYMDVLLNLFPDYKHPWAQQVPLSPLDSTFEDWVYRTGELPPDFSRLTSSYQLPDPITFRFSDSNGSSPSSAGTWFEQRNILKKGLKYWITGSTPPPPHRVRVKQQKTYARENIRIIESRIYWEADSSISLGVELFLPEGEGPFPVILTPGYSGESWMSLQSGLRRGYAVCLYHACDDKDDTDSFAAFYYPKYDFSRITRRAWASHRALDYLESLSYIDMSQTAIMGLSRDAKQVFIAAAFDERIQATVLCSGGTGGEIPFRYTGEMFDNESIAAITTNFPDWFHPRLKFFAGRPNYLPVDQHFFSALIAPRHLLFSSSRFEHYGNPKGIQEHYAQAKSVFAKVGAEDHIRLHLRSGLHRPAIRDMEIYVDFFDTAFGRKDSLTLEGEGLYNFSFHSWQERRREYIDPEMFSSKKLKDLSWNPDRKLPLTLEEWRTKRKQVQKETHRLMGKADAPESFSQRVGEDYLKKLIGFPKLEKNIHREPLHLGELYYKTDSLGKPVSDAYPVVIFLHEYAYSSGYKRNVEELFTPLLEQGFAIYAFDLPGFGSRLEEVGDFYARYPQWSLMGAMVSDVRHGLSVLTAHPLLDKKQFYVLGFSLGAQVGTISAALDNRIKGMISICGVHSLRQAGKHPEKGLLSISANIHGLIPRLGFFEGSEERIPTDFDEWMACIAPRPQLVVGATWDQYADMRELQQMSTEVKKIYGLYGKEEKFHFEQVHDFHRMSAEMRAKAIEWLLKQSQSSSRF
ncbi:MAG: alpha/beta fold hydrolase [Bacteroidota bacterium]